MPGPSPNPCYSRSRGRAWASVLLDISQVTQLSPVEPVVQQPHLHFGRSQGKQELARGNGKTLNCRLVPMEGTAGTTQAHEIHAQGGRGL